MGWLMESSIHNTALDFYSRCVEALDVGYDEFIPTTYGAIIARDKWTSAPAGSLERHYKKKQACFWRTIITSSLGEGLYPYSQHIRTLDLKNLSKLLMNPTFQNSSMGM